jgi:hypothetical protein
MHGKHSRVVLIPLYRNMVCNNGIDSRKCATGLQCLGEKNGKRMKSGGWKNRAPRNARIAGTLATVGYGVWVPRPQIEYLRSASH